MRAFALRVLAYLLVIAALFHLTAVAMGIWGWEVVLREYGLLESSEVAALLVSTCLALALAWQVPRSRSFYLLLALGFAAAEFREFDDSRLYRSIPGSLRWLGFMLLIGAAALRDPRGIAAAALDLLDRPHGVLLVAGAVISLVWAQLLGQPSFWIPLYRDPGRGRRVVEESLELAGWVLVAFALLEEYVRVRRDAARSRARAAGGVGLLLFAVAL